VGELKKQCMEKLNAEAQALQVLFKLVVSTQLSPTWTTYIKNNGKVAAAKIRAWKNWSLKIILWQLC
jgi:hypothetical protein